MTALRQNDEPVPEAIRKSPWLPALERELRSRVGWVDEAVSPFAAKTHAARTAARIKIHETIPAKNKAHEAIQEKNLDTFHPVRAA